MKKHIIFVDLDGTLMDDHTTPNQETVEYLKSIKDQAYICINTGRPYRASRKIYELLELDTPLANYNGAYIHNPSNTDFQEHLLTLDKDQFFKILRDKDDAIECAYGEVRDEVFVHKYTDKFDSFFEADVVHKDNIFEELKTSPNSIIIFAKDGKTEEIIDYITVNTNFKCRHWGAEWKFIIELFHDDISKGTACEYIVNQLGLSQDQVICFGDEQNDIPMFQYANISVAMGNAKLDRIGDHHDFQTLKNTEAGIKHFLTDFFEGTHDKYKKGDK